MINMCPVFRIFHCLGDSIGGIALLTVLFQHIIDNESLKGVTVSGVTRAALLARCKGREGGNLGILSRQFTVIPNILLILKTFDRLAVPCQKEEEF